MHTGDVKRLLEEAIPFLRKAGVRLEEASGGEARLRLPLDEGNLGQGGLVHPGAIFTLAEAAATALGLQAFDPAQFTLISKAGDVRFRRPARGDLWARAQLEHDTLEATRERGSSEGKVDVAVPVALSDQSGERVAEATVTLSLRRL